MRKLLYAGADQDLYSKLYKKLKGHYSISRCSSGPDAIEDFLAFQPNILIIDTSFPGCDVVGLLRTSMLIVPPAKTILMDSVCHAFAEQLQQHIGLDVLLFKPVTINALIEHINQLNAEIQITPEMQTERLLLQLGISRSRSAFEALFQAIAYRTENPNCLFTSDLMVSIAKKCKSTSQATNKAISRCIKKMWRYYNPEFWDHLFPDSTKAPSCSVFITTLSNYLQQLEAE